MRFKTPFGGGASLGIIKFLVVYSVVWVLFPGISSAEKLNSDRKKFLQGVEIKLQKMLEVAGTDVQRAESEIRNCEASIRKAENIIRTGRETNRPDVQAKGQQTLEKAREAKRKNEAIRSNGEMRKKRAEEALRTIRGLLAQVGAPPTASPEDVSEGGIPKLNCRGILDSWEKDASQKAYLEQRDCSCPSVHRAPLCREKGSNLPEARERTFSFYWMIEGVNSQGTLVFLDGTYVEVRQTYEEALKGCQQDAKRSGGVADHIVQLTCIPTTW